MNEIIRPFGVRPCPGSSFRSLAFAALMEHNSVAFYYFSVSGTSTFFPPRTILSRITSPTR
jgi:hypothetical protein